MKKITNILLTGITLLGGYLVGEGLITGEQLSDIQSVIGLALAGGGVSIAMVLSILRAIPTQLVNAGYTKAVEKYGQTQVDNVLANFDEFRNVLNDANTTINEVKVLLEEAKQERQALLEE
jgi:hypothetical protein